MQCGKVGHAARRSSPDEFAEPNAAVLDMSAAVVKGDGILRRSPPRRKLLHQKGLRILPRRDNVVPVPVGTQRLYTYTVIAY